MLREVHGRSELYLSQAKNAGPPQGRHRRHLRDNKDVFAWKPSDMSGIPREVAEHTLKIHPSSKPVKQHLHCFDEEKHRTTGEEIATLLVERFIKEVYHPEWLANPVPI